MWLYFVILVIWLIAFVASFLTLQRRGQFTYRSMFFFIVGSFGALMLALALFSPAGVAVSALALFAIPFNVIYWLRRSGES